MKAHIGALVVALACLSLGGCIAVAATGAVVGVTAATVKTGAKGVGMAAGAVTHGGKHRDRDRD